MKATGIVRRIDDLGRIVIPKEVRRQLRISENTPLELFLNGDEIVLKKYDYAVNFKHTLGTLQEELLEIKDNFGSDNAEAISKHIQAINELTKDV